MTQLAAQIAQAQALLRASQYTVALTGAGISTASGIPDFRSPDSGLWEHTNPLEIASIYAFRHRPQDFYDWIYQLAQRTVLARPNAAHLALAQLEAHGPLKALITQNIDTLHSQAGSRALFELHGHLRTMTCLRCYEEYDSAPYIAEFLRTRVVPLCPCGGVLKPNAILFGEQLPVRVLTAAKQHTRACDLMLVAGSSLEVAPAGDLPAMAKGNGARLIVVNYEATHADEFADVVIRADVTVVLPQLAAPFLAADGVDSPAG